MKYETFCPVFRGKARKGKCVVLKTEIYQTKCIWNVVSYTFYFIFCYLYSVCWPTYRLSSIRSHMKMSVLLY